MSYYTPLRGMNVIDDTNYQDHVQAIANGYGMGGYNARDYSTSPFTSPYTRPIIPRSEWAERIREQEAKKCTPDHLHEFYDCKILNQKSWGYCWAYGMVGAMQVSYAMAGGFVPHLSATSLAWQIKRGRNEGGWAGEALKGLETFGVSEIKYWPEAADGRDLITQEQKTNAALHKVHHFEELPRQSFDAVASALLQGFPVTLGLMWWGHLVFATKLVVLRNGGYGVVIVNSWGSTWETGGKSVLAESKATPHEGIAIMSVTPRMAA